jgi:hypothetical protein
MAKTFRDPEQIDILKRDPHRALPPHTLPKFPDGPSIHVVDDSRTTATATCVGDRVQRCTYRWAAGTDWQSELIGSFLAPWQIPLSGPRFRLYLFLAWISVRQRRIITVCVGLPNDHLAWVPERLGPCKLPQAEICFLLVANC